MVNYKAGTLDQVFAALSDATRRAMLTRLRRRTLSVTELAEPFAMSLPAILKHLRVLERAGLIESRKDGRVHRSAIRPGALKEAASWISRHRAFWENQFDSRDRHLAQIRRRRS
jgi:DNA-binding transcriptional ArsR family regulator